MIIQQPAKQSPLRLRIIKTLITSSALLAALIGATAFTSGPEKVMDTTHNPSVAEPLFSSGPEAAIDAVAGPGFTESLETAASELIAPVINIFNHTSDANVPCAIASR
ncbi:MAG: hypothetical protein SH847_25140 [Roseiflexaceae bacterium]|nr:hypothetical protein [Roseiflexaceae bacterium]